MTVFLGASVVLFEKSRSPGLNTFTVILYTSLVFFLVSISGAVYCLIRSYREYKYSFLARPVEIQTYADKYERFLKFEEVHLEDPVDKCVLEEMQDYVLDMLNTCGTENRSNNRTRGAWLYRTSYLLIIALVALVVGRASIFCFSEEKPQKIEITHEDPTKPIHVWASGLPDVQRVEVTKAPPVGISNLPAIQDVRVTNLPTAHRVEVTNTPKVEISNLPAVQKVEVANPPHVQNVEITGQKSSVKVEVVQPKKGP